MAYIPQNITRDHLQQAINKIDAEGVPPGGASKYYDVVYNDKKYPPKLIVSYANIFANGQLLDRTSFGAGRGKQSFKVLESHGFKIIEKKNDAGFFPQLEAFIAQAETGRLAVSDYIRRYQNLTVKVSFGQGVAARIPWIAFLKEGQSVQHGIYPVYLYFKDSNKLILAYGISETQIATSNWGIPNLQTIENFFSQKNLPPPFRYGSSFVFRAYSIPEDLQPDDIDEDLDEILSVYKQISFSPSTETHTPMQKLTAFYEDSRATHLHFTPNLCNRYIASLITKPFVILTGLSGSGKTKLAQAFAMWMCEDLSQYCLVPVGADWTNREPLFGFPNALRSNEYVKPENKVLELFLHANENPAKPYFLILDEMNLSHVERYFSDFLSVMESKEALSLHSGEELWNNVPGKIPFPSNVFITGTVNIDETTYMFSPKVLDRANVIEFRVTESEMEKFLQGTSSIDLNGLLHLGVPSARKFVQLANEKIESINSEGINSELIKFFIELKRNGAEFGYRTASEIIRFATVIQKMNVDWSESDIVDVAIMQKLLPKVHGSRRKLEPILHSLASLCLASDAPFEYPLKLNNVANVKYPISYEKIIRMLDNLISNGFTSYAEA